MSADRRHAVWLAGIGCLVAVWLAQVSIPLLERGHRAGPTLAVVAFLALSVACSAAAASSVRAGAVAVTITCAFGLAVEVVGTRTGVPFGAYSYTDALQPHVAGVPVAVVLAWAGMGIPAWAVACALGGNVSVRILCGAVALTGWDLFLDPQMVSEGYWVWPHDGAYRGVPLSNYLGWLVASTTLMAVLHVVVPGLRSRLLAASYLLMSIMETVGFAVFFGDAVVALVGGVVCLPLGVAAVRAR
jgi:uncharacterized membrane protein